MITSTLTFAPATKTQAKARAAIVGPAGCGKTYTALLVSRGLVGDDGRIAVIDTEHGSAAKYAGLIGFDVVYLDVFAPSVYIQALQAAEAAGYDVVIIDSLSHEWAGTGGALEMVDTIAAREKSGNSYTAWRKVTPEHTRLIDAIIRCRAHVVATMRTKTEYVLETNAAGKQVPRKVGLAPIQRDGVDYEFDVVAEMDLDHSLVVTKTRCPDLDGVVIRRPGVDLGRTIAAWLSDGAPAPQAPIPPNDERVRGIATPMREPAPVSTSAPRTNGALRGELPSDWPTEPAPDIEPTDDEDDHIRPLCEAAIRDRDVEALPAIRERIARLPDGFHKTGARRWLALATVLLDNDGLTVSARRAARALIDGLPDDTPGKSQAIDILAAAEAA